MIKETLIVSDRGQITIPKSIRDKYGIKPKQPVIIEEKNGEIVIKPVVTIPKNKLKTLARDLDEEIIKEILESNQLSPEEEKEIIGIQLKS